MKGYLLYKHENSNYNVHVYEHVCNVSMNILQACPLLYTLLPTHLVSWAVAPDCGRWVGGMAAVALPLLPPGWGVLSVESMGLNIPEKRELAVDIWQLKNTLAERRKPCKPAV